MRIKILKKTAHLIQQKMDKNEIILLGPKISNLRVKLMQIPHICLRKEKKNYPKSSSDLILFEIKMFYIKLARLPDVAYVDEYFIKITPIHLYTNLTTVTNRVSVSFCCHKYCDVLFVYFFSSQIQDKQYSSFFILVPREKDFSLLDDRYKADNVERKYVLEYKQGLIKVCEITTIKPSL